jgi:hypothetical protein
METKEESSTTELSILIEIAKQLKRVADELSAMNSITLEMGKYK